MHPSLSGCHNISGVTRTTDTSKQIAAAVVIVLAKVSKPPSPSDEEMSTAPKTCLWKTKAPHISQASHRRVERKKERKIKQIQREVDSFNTLWTCLVEASTPKTKTTFFPLLFTPFQT